MTRRRLTALEKRALSDAMRDMLRAGISSRALWLDRVPVSAPRMGALERMGRPRPAAGERPA